MKLVIKIGGQAQEDPKVRRELARQIAQLHQERHHVVVVHGGGKQLTQTLARLGIPAEFHNGLRVTDGATRDVALMVLAGLVNKQWVAELEARGQRALGICGGDGGLIRARKFTAQAKGQHKDLGFVGRPVKVDPAILEMAFKQGLVAVVASLGLDRHGEYLNINADDLAAALATALHADRLLYLTESGGVWDAERQVLPKVTLREIPRLIQKGIVRDGMIPKLQSCARTLRQHVQEIDIISPAVPRVLLRVLQAGARVGTRIVKGA
jgi:acetylglutamate kinase